MPSGAAAQAPAATSEELRLEAAHGLYAAMGPVDAVVDRQCTPQTVLAALKASTYTPDVEARLTSAVVDVCSVMLAKVKERMVAAAARIFTTDELQAALVFVQTSAGQSLLRSAAQGGSVQSLSPADRLAAADFLGSPAGQSIAGKAPEFNARFQSELNQLQPELQAALQAKICGIVSCAGAVPTP
jgi:hypothetical protein